MSKSQLVCIIFLRTIGAHGDDHDYYYAAAASRTCCVGVSFFPISQVGQSWFNSRVTCSLYSSFGSHAIRTGTQRCGRSDHGYHSEC